MPRRRRVGAPEPRRRSRTGCWPCKSRRVKCDENRPICISCQTQGETCDYNIRLNWGGRGKKQADYGNTARFGQINFSLAVGVTGQDATSVVTVRSPESNYQTGPTQQHFVETDNKSAAITFNSPPGKVTSSRTTLNSQSRGVGQYLVNPALIEPSDSTAADNKPASFQCQLPRQLPQSYGRDGPTIDPTVHDSFSGPGRVRPKTPPLNRPTKRFRHQNRPSDSSLSNTTMLQPSLVSIEMHATEPEDSSLNTSASANLTSFLVTPCSCYACGSLKCYSSKLLPLLSQGSSGLPQLPASSLLCAPPAVPYNRNVGSTCEKQSWTEHCQDVYHDTITWGVDRGLKDLDIGKNDDMNAISASSPAPAESRVDLILDNDGYLMPFEFGFGMETSNVAFDNGSYYDKHVPICIPRALEPLPNKLLNNPMNLLYFVRSTTLQIFISSTNSLQHHFLNHTADCLIPHDCSSNPFRTILPSMAMRDDNLLNLLLAYSASHRARLLRQPEPAIRIALWVQDIFPSIRKALDDPNKIISNSNLATAIMLSSLEIVSPKALGVAVPWQKHLDTARQIIAARGGPQGMRTASRRDKVSSFLWSWFVYLDVLGSLSGPSSSFSSGILDYETRTEDEYEIDCILGFTSRCVRILAKIAQLARTCDNQRIGPDLTIRPNWKPSEATATCAKKLEADLTESRLHPLKPCTHMQSNGDAAYQRDSLEMSATNEAFHWAGLVHLDRRILGKPFTHVDVQNTIREIHGALYKVRRGSSAEACLLLPMLTAGCDTLEEKQKTDILERIKCVERLGMTQVRKARTLMERSWETGKPWETLVAGEFFG